MGWGCVERETSDAMSSAAGIIDRGVSGGAATGGGPGCARSC